MKSIKKSQHTENVYMGDNIAAIREDLGVTQTEFAKMAGVAQTTVSAWETRGQMPRKATLLHIIEQYPHLTLDDFYGNKGGFARTLGSGDIVRTQNAPLYGSIAAGTPLEMIPVTEYVEVPTSLIARYPNCFFLRVNGNSMNRIVPNGYLALIDPDQKAIMDGRIVVLRVDGSEATLKCIRVDDERIVITPDSHDPSFQPQIIERTGGNAGFSSIEILGTAVWFCAPVPKLVNRPRRHKK